MSDLARYTHLMQVTHSRTGGQTRGRCAWNRYLNARDTHMRDGQERACVWVISPALCTSLLWYAPVSRPFAPPVGVPTPANACAAFTQPLQPHLHQPLPLRSICGHSSVTQPTCSHTFCSYLLQPPSAATLCSHLLQSTSSQSHRLQPHGQLASSAGPASGVAASGVADGVDELAPPSWCCAS
jgi:hypothetical protein